MKFHIYDIELSELKEGDMLKVTRLFENPYCHRTMEYNPEVKKESFWTQVMKIYKNGKIKVLVSNNCTLSDSYEQVPLKFEDQILIKKNNIKEYKKNNPEEISRKVNIVIEILNSLPNSLKDEISKMSESDRFQFLNDLTDNMNINIK
tara:strand:+ start:512 stop:955 length:444 start_codon:yes stop_codon:yes gene_type:complete